MARNERLKFRNNVAFDRQKEKWHIRVMVDGKAIQRGGFTSKATAKQYLDYLLLQSLNVPVDKPTPTFAEAWSSYLERLELLNRSENTLSYYTNKGKILLESFGKQQLSNITQRDVEEFVRDQKEELGAGSINKLLSAMNTVYRHSEITPSWKLDLLSHQPKQRRMLPAATIKALWLALDDEAKPALGLTLLAGLRASEALEADSTWVDGDELRIVVKKTGTTNRQWIVPTLKNVLPTKVTLFTLDHPLLAHG